MTQVVIQFEGICVNFRQIDFPFLPTKHRVVLINASTISSVWNNDIALHYAGFSTELDAGAPSIPLNGSTVSISNAVTTGAQTGVTYEASYYQLMPFLTTLTPGIAGVNLALLLGHNPMLASCYFDIDYGTIGVAGSKYGAAMTVVTIQTTGAPEYVEKPFPSGLSSAPLPTLSGQPATSNMYFFNEEQNPLDSSTNDFLLSYLVVNWPPGPTPNIPQPISAGNSDNRKSTFAPATGFSAMFTDVGCSNSNYP